MSRSPERKQVRRGRARWQKLIDEQASSGLGQRAFCDRREITYSSFCHWKRKLEVEPSGSGSRVVKNSCSFLIVIFDQMLDLA